MMGMSVRIDEPQARLADLQTLRSGGTPQVTECRFSGKPQDIVPAAVRKR